MRIGVVGGGASAVCVVDALAQSEQSAGELTVFEPAQQRWRGRAYQWDADAILVNSPPDDMSVRWGDDGHYMRWLLDRYGADGVPEFESRAVYGDYLVDTAAAGIGRLRSRGWRVDVLGATVTGASRNHDQVVLKTDQWVSKPFDSAVLAVGGGRPRDAYGLAGRRGFVDDPYPVSKNLADIGRDEHIAVIGSGLTAVDVVVALDAQGHRGSIALLSRHGVLPAVRQRPIAFHPKHFVPARVSAMTGRSRQIRFADVVELLRPELAEASSDLNEVWAEISAVQREEPVDRLRRQLADVCCDREGVRVLQKVVPLCGPILWPLLFESTRRRLLSTHHRTLMSLCCPMPPSSARTVLRLVESGQLTVLGGARRIVGATGDRFQVTTKDRDFTVCRVVNAANAPPHRVPQSARQLVHSLYGEGLAMPYPDGGLCVDTATSRLVGQCRYGPRMYAIGDIVGGTFFFTFGVQSIVDRCHDIVTDLLTDKGPKR